MLIRLLIILLLWISPCMAKTYYCSNDGSGDFITLEQVNNALLVSEDSVLFKRGNMWRGQLLPKLGVTYGAYGEGNKPKLLGSLSANDSWVNKGNNIWEHAGFNIDVGNIIFDNGGEVGIKCYTEDLLDSQNKFWYDTVNKSVKIYSLDNPSNLYNSIECALRQDIIDLTQNNVVIENLEFRYAGKHGIGVKKCDNIIIQDCEFYFIGGGQQYPDKPIRLGNAIEFYDGSTNIIIRRNFFTDIFDEAITLQGTKGTFDNIKIYNNIFTDTRVGITVYLTTSGIINNVCIDNNICLSGDGGWQIDQMTGSGTRLISVARYNKPETLITNINIRNNILFENGLSTNSCLYVGSSNVYLDNNLYYRSNGLRFITYMSKNYTMDEFSAYKAYSGQDIHSIVGNPKLKSNYRFLADSPCIGIGKNIDYITEDFNKNKRYTNHFDIGAYAAYRKLTNFKGADGTNYRNAFIKTKITNTNSLNTPFTCYHISIAYNGVLHYCHIPASLIGKEVIAYIHYAIKDEAKVKACAGYLGNDWREVQKNEFVSVNWDKKKLETITNYDGEDKDELGSIYPAADVVTQIYN